jgi:hypothetical protein
MLFVEIHKNIGEADESAVETASCQIKLGG